MNSIERIIMKVLSVGLQGMLAAALVGAATCVHAQLLTNGSFESGTFINQGNDTETFTAGATTMSGWTTTGNFVSWIGPSNPFGLMAQDGSFFLDLTGYHTGAPFGGVTQTIATTPGQPYALTFYLGSYTARWGGPPVSILASAGATSGTFTNSATTGSSTWTPETLDFTATGTSTVITLTGTAGVEYIGLDNVNVACTSPSGCGTGVPEPRTLTLLGLGLAGIWFARRERKTCAT
jgi:hypothetical protein